MPKLTESYNLYVLRPDLAKEWHPTKNGNLGPKDVTPGSSMKVWWLCEKGHWWQASVRCRTRGMRCSYCLSVQKHGDQRMVDLKPELLKEWHPSRNRDIRGVDVLAHHREKVWWICSHGHEWEASIRSRIKGKLCPFCSDMMPRTPCVSSHEISSTLQKAGDRPASSRHTGFTALPDGIAAPYVGSDLRKTMRYQRSETVMIGKPGEEILGYAQLSNFSAEGLMLRFDFAISPGELIEIRFDKPLHSSISKVMTTRVVWCRDLEAQDETDSRFGIGVNRVYRR
ncbi:MAG: zinc-ribbon domain-containing protein [Deltaproteobacteria bacterium]|nr:zinc-ribbon domain-containing protein [Deltaproteobacteria bacterium]